MSVNTIKILTYLLDLLRSSKTAHTVSPLSNVDGTPSTNSDKANMVELPFLKTYLELFKILYLVKKNKINGYIYSYV